MNKPSETRYSLIDQIRGFSVVLMIIFHFCYDLSYFKYIKIQIITDPFWYYFPRLIVFLFMLAMGLSLPLTHKHSFNKNKFFKRLGVLVISASIISISTYFMYPKNWIYFGTLHSIAVASVLSLPFIHRPFISIGLCLFISITHLTKLINWPWIKLPHASLDYIPTIPWISVVFLGIFLCHQGFHKLKPLDQGILRKPGRGLSFLGKHSLLIYLLHQPILFSAVYLFYILTA